MRLRPTGHALSFAVAVAALAAAAIAFQSNPAWLLTLLIAAAGVLAAAWTAANLRGLAAGADAPALATAGGEAELPIRVVNPGRHARRAVLIEVELHGPGLPERIQAWLAEVPPGITRVAVAVPTPRPGVAAIGGVRLRTVWPLGLVEAAERAPAIAELLIAPRPVAAPLPGAAAGDDRDFAGHRAWRIGMAASAIDWRATLRRGEHLAKDFAAIGAALRFTEPAAAARAAADGRAGDGEHRLGILAHWVELACRSGWRWSLAAGGRELAEDGGAGHRDACLRLLARAAAPIAAG